MLGSRLIIGLCLIALFSTAAVSAPSFAAGDVRLADAAMQGDLAGVRSMLKEKVDVNAAQGDGMTALHWAAATNNLEMAQALLAAGADVNAVTRIGGQTPLFIACTAGNAALINIFIKAGSNPNAVNTVDGQTALMRASASGSAEAVTVLLDHGANVNAKETARGETALMFAAAENRADVIKVLVKHGADMKVATSVEDLRNKPRYDDDGNIIPPGSSKAGADAKGGKGGGGNNRSGATVIGGMTALLFAARDGQFDAVRALVDAGANIDEPSLGDFSTPIIIAIANAHIDIGKYLLDHGANPNAANSDGLTPLYATVDVQYAPHSWAPAPLTDHEQVTYLQLMDDLLKKGANPNARLTKKLYYRPTSHDRQWARTEGTTAFWRAAWADDVPAMKLLVDTGADPKIASDEGVTPLMAAAGIGWVQGDFSQTWREDKSRLKAVQYCVELGLDVNARDSQNQTALHGAAWVADKDPGDIELIHFLIDKGAKLDVKTKKGWYVSDMPNGLIISGGDNPLIRPHIVKLLIDLGAPAPAAEPLARTSK
jgi:ankyrin repeat protein